MKELDIVAIWAYRGPHFYGEENVSVDRCMVADFPADLKQYADNHQTILANGPNGLVFIHFGDFKAYFVHPYEVTRCYCEYKSGNEPLWVCNAGMPEKAVRVLEKYGLPIKPREQKV